MTRCAQHPSRVAASRNGDVKRLASPIMLTFHLAWLETLDAGRYGADAQLEYVNLVMVAGQVCLAVLYLGQTGAGQGGPESPPRHLHQVNPFSGCLWKGVPMAPPTCRASQSSVRFKPVKNAGGLDLQERDALIGCSPTPSRTRQSSMTEERARRPLA
ncbi:hypothetical protein E2C01_001269 [Portunus trituberculatus]|uniref:Uncharacterized protein n=1 Tax=Portunus trituberculatus TaxID=210409 RepID=A0A5B7CK02_PORTR|nr:hypothetical protein [Portunus trituberculatus]